MMFQKAQYWPRMVERIPREARGHLPHSARVELATPATIDGYIQRIEAAFATLRGELRAFKPDALIMIGDDEGDMFDEANNPSRLRVPERVLSAPAQRCAQLGEAIADVLRDRPERVAIYASGGLSHDPGMYNAGWIDQPLDRWILERLERNDLQALQHLFTFDSDTLRSGTGEVRAWISVAAAMKRPAKVVEYVPAHCTQTGRGFAYWPPLAGA